MGKKSPKAPDFASLAEQTAQASREATRDQTYANRANQYGPGGSLTWDAKQVIDPATGQPVTQWDQTVSLSPEEQRAYDAQKGIKIGRSELGESMLGDISQDFGERMNFDEYGKPIGMDPMDRMSGAGEGIRTEFDAGSIGSFDPRSFGKPRHINPDVATDFQFSDRGLDPTGQQTSLDFSGAPTIDDPRTSVQRAEDSVYERGASRLDPQFAQESQALDVRLRSQGLNPGDEAYDAQMKNFQDRKTDAYANLEREAQAEGFRQGQGMFGMQSQHRGQMTGETAQQGMFANQALQNMFGQQMGARGQDLDIANAINQFQQTGDMANLEALVTQRAQDAGMRGQDIKAMVANIGQQVQQNALGLQAQGMGNEAQQQGWNQHAVHSLIALRSRGGRPWRQSGRSRPARPRSRPL